MRESHPRGRKEVGGQKGRPRIEHRVEDGIEVKRCGTCKEWSPLDRFAKDVTRWDGLNSKCKAYFVQISKAYRARKSATRTAWRHRNPGREEATRRRYLERNPDRVRELDRERYPREREKRLLDNGRYYEADQDRGVAQVRQRRIDNPQAAPRGVRDRARRRARLSGSTY
jgi:hypothetical protein